MRTLILALVLGGAMAAAQVSDEAVEQAIAAGLAQEVPGVVEVGSSAAGQFSVQIAGPLGRVASAAAHAQREHEPFGLAQVTADLLGPTIRITAFPNDPDFAVFSRQVITPAAERIVLQPRGSRNARTAVEALHSETFPMAWSNGLGARAESQGVIADFDRASLPGGELEVVVQTTRGERRYRVRPSDLEGVQ